MVFKSIKQLTDDDINKIFNYCSAYAKYPEKKYRILKSKLIATIFFESSTRTQLSFQKAAQNLGAGLLSFSDIAQSRSNCIDNERLSDALKIMSFYCDCLIFRSKNSLLDNDIDDITIDRPCSKRCLA